MANEKVLNYLPGRMYIWMEEWMYVKVVLRIVNSNKISKHAGFQRAEIH